MLFLEINLWLGKIDVEYFFKLTSNRDISMYKVFFFCLIV